MKAIDRMISAAFSPNPRWASTAMARKGAQVNSTRSEKVSPETEAKCAVRSARPACPLRAMGWPSSVVIIASGVPGVLNRIAGTAPPTVAPFITPTRKPSTGSSASGVKPKIDSRIGSDTAIRNGPASPGVAPPTTPTRKPPRTISTVTGMPIPRISKAAGPAMTAMTPAQTYSSGPIRNLRSAAAGWCRTARRRPGSAAARRGSR